MDELVRLKYVEYLRNAITERKQVDWDFDQPDYEGKIIEFLKRTKAYQDELLLCSNIDQTIDTYVLDQDMYKPFITEHIKSSFQEVLNSFEAIFTPHDESIIYEEESLLRKMSALATGYLREYKDVKDTLYNHLTEQLEDGVLDTDNIEHAKECVEMLTKQKEEYDDTYISFTKQVAPPPDSPVPIEKVPSKRRASDISDERTIKKRKKVDKEDSVQPSVTNQQKPVAEIKYQIRKTANTSKDLPFVDSEYSFEVKESSGRYLVGGTQKKGTKFSSGKTKAHKIGIYTMTTHTYIQT